MWGAHLLFQPNNTYGRRARVAHGWVGGGGGHMWESFLAQGLENVIRSPPPPSPLSQAHSLRPRELAEELFLPFPSSLRPSLLVLLRNNSRLTIPPLWFVHREGDGVGRGTVRDGGEEGVGQRMRRCYLCTTIPLLDTAGRN